MSKFEEPKIVTPTEEENKASDGKDLKDFFEMVADEDKDKKEKQSKKREKGAKIVPPSELSEKETESIKNNLGVDINNKDKNNSVKKKTLSEKNQEEINKDWAKKEKPEKEEGQKEKVIEIETREVQISRYKEGLEKLRKKRDELIDKEKIENKGKKLRNLNGEIIELEEKLEFFKSEEKEPDKEKETKNKEETTEEESKESKEISELVTIRFEHEINIKKEDLENIEGFNELSLGQQLLVLENLKQATLKDIRGEGSAKSKKEMADAKFLGKIWKGISKKYQIAKIEKLTAKDIKEAGIKFHKKNLEQLTNGIRAHGPEVKMKSGYLEIQYAPGVFKDFNEAATKFSKIPDEWSKETASKEEQKKYKEAKDKYEQEKKDILNFKAEGIGEESAAIYMNNIESNIILNQLLNTHPEVEDQLKKIEDEKIWKKVLKDIVTERGIYAGAGFLTRTATISMIGAIGAPLAAAGMGGFMARKRAKETLKEREIMARKGEEDKSKEAKDFVDAEYLYESIDFLNKELTEESLSEDKKEEMIRSLKFHIEDAKNKIEDGTVNYGKKDVRLFNQYELIGKITYGTIMMRYYDINKEKYEKDIETIDGFLEKQDKEISSAQKKYVRNQVIKGAVMGAGFATAGYAIRYFSESLGWFGGSDEIKKAPSSSEVPVVGKVEEVEEISNILESKTAKKGDSPLSIAKKVYIENAEKLGYKGNIEDASEVKKWAERFSTRHIIGQYISEHPDDYKELIDKIGNPPENPVELDKWMSKVPGSTFNEVLNNKVPNLVQIGDTVSINANGNINAYDPDGKLRIGNLPIESQEIISTEDIEGIMAVENFSDLSLEQVEKIDMLFSQQLGASFEGFQSFDAAERAEKIAGLEKLINKLEKEPSSKFIKRQLQELNMVKDIWEKFGIENIEALKEELAPEVPEVPKEPILDETGTEIKGETPVGSEDNIKEIEELFKKEGSNKKAIDKVIEQVKSGKINREDFREFLFDDARKDDGFISDEERWKINAIMTKLGDKIK